MQEVTSYIKLLTSYNFEFPYFEEAESAKTKCVETRTDENDNQLGKEVSLKDSKIVKYSTKTK